MTSDDERRERDLRAGLSALLDDVQPGQPPVAAVLRKGKVMRLSRRLVVAAGVAVAVAAAVVIPAALRGVGGQLPVSPVGKAGVIASGRLEGQPWRIVVDQKAGRLCAGETGLRQSCVSLRSLERLNGPGSLSLATVAVALHSAGMFLGLPPWNALFGIVRPDVTRVVMSLSSDRSVTLRPVLMAGYRWVGLVFAPINADSEIFVTKVTVYSGATELGYSVPAPVYYDAIFRPGRDFVSWYRPGETGPAQRSGDIAGSGSGSHFWDAHVDAGPWGYCVTLQAPDGNNGIPENCWSPASLRASARVIMRLGSPPAVPRWIVGTARPSVAYLLMELANGRSVKVPVAVFSGQGFYAMRIGPGPAITGWGAYNAAGRRLYGGIGPPDGGS
jgi:hypothetical protein